VRVLECQSATVLVSKNVSVFGFHCVRVSVMECHCVSGLDC